MCYLSGVTVNCHKMTGHAPNLYCVLTCVISQLWMYDHSCYPDELAWEDWLHCRSSVLCVAHMLSIWVYVDAQYISKTFLAQGDSINKDTIYELQIYYHNCEIHNCCEGLVCTMIPQKNVLCTGFVCVCGFATATNGETYNSNDTLAQFFWTG